LELGESMKVTLKRRPGKRGTSLFLAWWAGGKWNYEFLKLRLIGDKLRDRETLRLAERKRANREEEMESMSRGTAPTHKRKLSFIQYFEGLEKLDKKTWRTCLSHLKDFPAARVPVGGIDQSWVQNFRKFLLERVSPSSAHTDYAILKAALNQAVNDGILQRSPAVAVDPIKVKGKEIIYLTADEVKALADTPCKHSELKRAFLFCCYTGLRFSDCKALQWGDYVDGKLSYQQKKTGAFEYLALPSGGAADKLLNANRSFMPNIFSLPVNDRANIWLREWGAAAGIKKHLHWHMSRDTCATRMLEQGVDLYTVQKILGHRSIAMTQKYARVTDPLKQAALASLPDIDIDLEKPADYEKIKYPEFNQAR
jgi:integrase